MLIQVAEGVLVHQSNFLQTNAVVVQGRAGVLLIDPGVRGVEMACLANDLSDSGQTVVAGFSTHPHWDHLLWHAGLGAPPRYGTARCAATAQDRLSDGIDSRRLGIPEQVPLDMLGLIRGRLGFRVGLGHIAEANLGAGKTADGLQSLRWFREGRFDLIESYCRQDVEITAKLFFLGRQRGYLLYRDGEGRLLRVPVDW